MRALGFLAIALLVGGCGQRGALTYDPQAVGVGTQRTVFVGSTRDLEPGTAGFGPVRSWEKRFARYDISIPPERTPGEITWPRRGRPIDPQRDFVTTREEMFANDRAFRASLAVDLAKEKRGERDAVIFVHGFNTNFSEGLYRIAQLDYDLKLPGVALHYSWPSAARPLAYVTDRESAAFARDGLVSLIQETERAGAQRIILLAHSMGASLTMESLRQIAIAGDRRTMEGIGGVILIAPDIDVDVFRSQALRIGDLPQPFVIFTSGRDRALALSAKLSGQRARLGNLEDIGPIADLKVTLLDVGAFSTGTGHFTPGDSPAVLAMLSGLSSITDAFNKDQSGQIGILSGTVLTLQRATQVILSPVAEIANDIQQ